VDTSNAPDLVWLSIPIVVLALVIVAVAARR
jgi:hypothetical protein